MYNEEEIEESLEFCRDIKAYYEKGGKKKAGRPDWKKSHRPEEGYGVPDNSLLGGSGPYLGGSEAKRGQRGLFSRFWNGFLFVFALLFLSYGISSFLENYCIWQTTVDGISMEPSLEDGDFLLIDKLTYRFREPRRFEIVVFPQKMDEYYVKRIVGLPGETVQIIDGTIYVDGIVLAENYGNEPISESCSTEEVTLSEDEYFVLGDNRNYSIDSRDASVGLVKKERIVGKAWILLYPFEDFRVFH